MEVEVIVAFESKVADGTNERLLIDVSLQMAFDVWFSWEPFAADVTVERLCIFVESFVESPQPFDLEVLLTEVAFVRSVD